MNEREQGTVIDWNDADGHGRIRSDAGDVLWAHFSFIEATGYRALTAGQRITFERWDAPTSPLDERPWAQHIQVES
jgi:cold shock CspA family protein